MQWEILLVVILAIGISTTVMEVRSKRIARKNESKNAAIGQRPAEEAHKKQDK